MGASFAGDSLMQVSWVLGSGRSLDDENWFGEYRVDSKNERGARAGGCQFEDGHVPGGHPFSDRTDNGAAKYGL